VVRKQLQFFSLGPRAKSWSAVSCFDIRGNTVKYIGLNLNQRVIGTSL